MTTALIAGRGRLPALLLDTLEAAGEPVVLAALEGHPPEGLEGHPPEGIARKARSFRLETLGGLISDLRAQGVCRACFAGAVSRPRSVDPTRIDAATKPHVPRLLQAMGQGDDGALRTVLALFEEAGIAIVAAHELRPDLLASAGVLGQVPLPEAAQADAARAQAIVAAMGQADVGQGCVVARGQALAIEAQAGTDWMLRGLALINDAAQMPSVHGITLLPPPDPAGGLLFKAAKPGQDRRIDLPAIGPDTLTLAADLGLAGVVVEAGGVVLLDRPQILSIADAAGLFVWARAST